MISKLDITKSIIFSAFWRPRAPQGKKRGAPGVRRQVCGCSILSLGIVNENRNKNNADTNENQWNPERIAEFKQQKTASMPWFRCSLACGGWQKIHTKRKASSANLGAVWLCEVRKNQISWPGAPGGAPFTYKHFAMLFLAVRQRCAAYI